MWAVVSKDLYEKLLKRPTDAKIIYRRMIYGIHRIIRCALDKMRDVRNFTVVNKMGDEKNTDKTPPDGVQINFD